MELKKTPFYQNHLDHKAKIVDFSGWALPVEYESVLKEAKAVRESGRCPTTPPTACGSHVRLQLYIDPG